MAAQWTWQVWVVIAWLVVEGSGGLIREGILYGSGRQDGLMTIVGIVARGGVLTILFMALSSKGFFS